MEILEKVKNSLPKEAISRIELEGSEIIVYTKDREFFTTHEDTVRRVVEELKKRIEVRPESNICLDQEHTKLKIMEIVPQDAKIKDVYFEPERGLVIIAAEKPGLVIGRGGETFRQIKAETFWVPRIERVPSIKSDIIEGIRKVIHTEVKFRKEFLNRIGESIFTERKTNRDWIRVIGLGGWREVGRSCILVETPKSKVLLDCGVNVGGTNGNVYPYLQTKEFDYNELDAIIVSHSHLDHLGCIPMLFEHGYNGPLYLTTPTTDLATLLWLDYIDVMQRNAVTPLFTAKGVKEAVKHSIPLEYGEVSDVAPDVRLTFQNAGHVLASSLIHLHIGEGLHNIVYASDIKFGRTTLLDPAFTDFQRVETLILESTYGGADDIMPPRQEAEKQLMEIINKTMERNSICLIPSFSAERAQDVMAILVENNFQYPVFIDGMIWDATGIFTAYPEYMNRTIQKKIFSGQDPFLSEIFKRIASPQEREKVWEERPCVIISTSGMLSVDSNEPVLFRNNHHTKIEPIGSLVDNLVQTSQNVNKIVGNIEGEIVRPSSLEVASYDFKTGEIKFYPVSYLIRHKVNKPIYEIVLRSGRKVNVTGSHSVMVMDKGQIKPKKVEEMKVGDCVIIPTKIDLEESEFKELNLVSLLRKNVPSYLLRTVYVQGIIEQVEDPSSWQKIHNTFPIVKIKSDTKVSDSSTIRFGCATKEKIPAIIKITPEFMRLLGYYAAEGYTGIWPKVRGGTVALTFGLHEKNLIEDAVSCIKKVFGLKAKVTRVPEKWYVRVSFGGKLMAYIFKYCFKVGCNAHEKQISNLVFDSTRENKLEFIRGYLLGDGNINKRESRVEVEFSSVSKNMISQLSYLFSLLGVCSFLDEREKKERIVRGREVKKSKIYRLLITTTSSLRKIAKILPADVMSKLDKMKEREPFLHCLPSDESGLKELGQLIEKTDEKSKWMKIKLLSKGRIGLRVVRRIIEDLEEVLKKQGKKEITKETLEFLEKITKGYIGFDEVIKIDRVSPSGEYVYDISVENLETFVGGFGGVLLHNTGGPVIEHLKALAEDSRNSLILVGYQSEGTLGRRIQKGWKEIPMRTENGKTITLNLQMEVQTVQGLSGHSDRNQLLSFVHRLAARPDKVIVVHGENQKAVELARSIHKIFRIETVAPRNLESIRLK